MKISNEIKRKIYSENIGQTMLSYWGETPEYNKIIGVIDTTIVFGWDEEDMEIMHSLNFSASNGSEKLLLTPISKISDEDAIEVSKVVGLNQKNNPKYSLVEFGKEYIKQSLLSDVFIYQLLQSKGYDLPHHLLNNQTPIEAGIAIDKTLMK